MESNSTDIKTIFILEDSEDLRDLYTYIFLPEQYKLEMFASVADFQTGNHSKVDLYLLDIMLPDGDGMEVCQQLKQNPLTADVPAILISAHQHAQVVAQKCPWAKFINKPFDIETLENMVTAELNINTSLQSHQHTKA